MDWISFFRDSPGNINFPERLSLTKLCREYLRGGGGVLTELQDSCCMDSVIPICSDAWLSWMHGFDFDA